MRTSKKLLSLFLAVVMVITTCSVGLTAFAKDYDNIWSDSSEAEDAFAALNGLADDYLPSALMGVDTVATAVYQKFAADYGKNANDLTNEEKEEIAEKATLSDILTALQPTLLSALEGVSQEEYANTTTAGGKYHSASYFDYLQKDDDSLDFYTLYYLCKDYRGDENLSEDTRDCLNEWYMLLNQIARLVPDNSVEDKIEELVSDFDEWSFNAEDGYEEYLDYINLYALESFFTDEYMEENCSPEILAGLEAKYAETVVEYKACGAPDDFTIDNFAQYLYYTRGCYGSLWKYIYAYYNAAVTAGKEINYTGREDFGGFAGGEDLPEDYTIANITPENYVDNISVAYFNAVGIQGTNLQEIMFSFASEESGTVVTNAEELEAVLGYEYEYWEGLFIDIAVDMYYEICSYNYNAIIEGLTIKYSDEINSTEEFEALVAAKMPADNKLSDTEINFLASLFFTTSISKDSNGRYVHPFATALSTGHLSGVYDSSYTSLDFDVLETLQDSYFSEFIAQICDEGENGGSTGESGKYWRKFKDATFSEWNNGNYPAFFLLDGTTISRNAVASSSSKLQRFGDSDTGLPILNYNDGATYDEAALDEIIAEAETYAYGQVASNYLSGATFTRNDTTGLRTNINLKNLVDAYAPQQEENKPVLTEEQKAILYGDYDLTGEVGTELVNYILNNTVSGITTNDTVTSIINGLVTTDINLESALSDIWERLCSNPLSTVFELVPILVVLVDELVLPLVFNSGVPEGHKFGDSESGVTFDKEAGLLEYLGLDLDIVGGLTEALLGNAIYVKDYSYDFGSYIGIKQLGWDLNTLLPNLMHWLLASKQDQKDKNVDGISYYDDAVMLVYYNAVENDNLVKSVLTYTGTDVKNADFDNYTVEDTDGNIITREKDGNDENSAYSYTYKGVTGDIATVIDNAKTEFNCYMTYSSSVPYLTGIYIADKALSNARVSDVGKLLGKLISNEELATALGEIVSELATLFSAALDEYVGSDLVDEIRYKKGDRLFAGLNNVFVALPQLIDIMEDLAADKYGVDKDLWTFCYDGKISTTSEGNLYGPTEDTTSTINAPLETFKSYSGSSDKNRSVDILDCFVSLVIEDWLNAVVSLVNNVISTDNLITQNIPIIASLLDALGGFGENSVFTEIFNGIFQLKRGDENSFEFTVRDNGFTGLSNENAYFLFSNINTLVNVIVSLVRSFSSSASAASYSASAVSILDSLSAETATYAEASSVGSSGYTTEELSSVDSLITKLDEMISSLLSDSSINDYAINNSANIASGVVSLLSNYIGSDDAESVLSLLDTYLYYFNGAGAKTPDENGNMKAEEVYTNENLSDLVVRTFALIETLVQNLLAQYDYVTGDGDEQKTYNLLASAINGVISPDSIGIRLDDYTDAQEKILDLKSWNSAISDDGALTSSVKNIDWNITDGDNEAFFDGLAASLRLVTSILGVILIDAGVYQNALQPILAAIGSYTGVKVDTAEEFADADNPYRDEALLGLFRPIASFLDKFLSAPATTLIQTVEGLSAILDDSNTEAGTIASIVSNTITPVSNELYGVCNILNLSSDKLNAASPTLAASLEEFVTDNIASLTVVEDNTLLNLKIKNVPLSGSNLVSIINAYLSSTGIVLNDIDWKAISEAKSPADALTYVIEYAVDTIAKSENLDAIVSLIGNDTVTDLVDAIKDEKITGKGIVDVILKILNVTQNPTIFAWSFEKYLLEAVEGFSYPLGLTKAQADEAATDIDAVINSIFPLLQSLGVDLGGATLSDILKNNLFKNSLLTQLAVTLYGALTSNETVTSILDILGIKSSTADVAALLTDTSYGATYTAAADAIKAKTSWSELKTVTKNSEGKDVTTYADINWGFTDGAANAQQGFVNALVAILRPLNNVLAVFLNTGDLAVGSALYDLICSLTVEETTSGDITYSLKDGVFTITVIDADNSASQPSVIKLDLTALDAIKNLKINGTNGYNSAVIPLLEAFQCEGIVTEEQYKSDVAAAKDNLLLDILNPIAGTQSSSLINKIVASPIVTIATVLPTVAAYLDASGLSQAVVNLLAPVADIIYSVNNVVDLENIITPLLGAAEGQSLADFVASALGMKAGSVKLDLGDIASINLEDMVVPLINLLLKSYGITLSDIDWNALISLGERTTYTSAATDADGNALTGKTLKNVDYGKVLITVLRYVFDNVISNIDSIKTLIMNITTDEKTGKKLSDNTTVAGILNNVFTQIKTHTSDEIIVALYYFFVGQNTDAYWNYTNYKTKTGAFKYPDGVTEENVTKLVAFLDGIIEEIDLNSILNQYLYTDSIINTIAKAIYTNIEKTKISGNIYLGDLLEIANISTDSKTVTAMLSDSKYGETAQFKTAVDAITAAGSWANVDFSSLTWGVKDQATFLKALVAVLRPFEGVLDVLLADGQLNLLEGINIPGSNDYVNSIVPLLEAFRCDGIKSYDKYLADKEKAYDNLLLDVLTPLFGFVDDVVANPLETIASVLPNVALFIGNDGLVQLVENLVTPISELVKQLNPIIDVDKLLQDLTKISGISVTNIGKFVEPYVGGGNLIALLNNLLATLGIQIPTIDWLGLASLGTVKNENSAVTCIGQRIVVDGNSSQVIVAVLRYVLNAVISNKTAITGLLGSSYTGTLKEILDILFAMSADDLLKIVFSLVDITQSPTEVYWSYEKYKSEHKSFKYPDGITAEDAENAVGQLDDAVNGVFALLQGLGVVDASNLTGLVNNLLFKNELLTQLAVTLYGALDTDKIAPYLEMAGISVSPKDVAKLLTDKSYGKTYSSAAKAIKSKSSWSKLKTVTKNKDGSETTTYANINWGFTNGAANAEQGFINALTAILRPFLDILGPFLNGSDLALGDILYGIITGLDISTGDKDKGDTLVTLKNGLLTISTQSNGVYSTALELNLANVKTLKSLNLYGSNGYENSIIPLLDVLQVENSEIKSFDQYVKDCKKAKDNILLDVLNPLMSFVDKVLEAPFDTIASVLPNLAYFIDNNGIGQLLDNLLSPVTSFLKEAKKDGLDIDKILKSALGKDLGTMLVDLLKLKNVKLTVKLTNLSALNIQDILIPLVNSLLKSTGIKLPEFKWSTIASHGDVVTSKSKAENSKGKFTNKEVIADKGETLVAVLRYVADLLITNAKSLKSLLGSIDAIKNNDTIKSIINSVFNTISTASDDEIVLAVFYFLCGEPTNAFWDYTAYETGNYSFSYPEGIDVDFLTNLPPMLDGLIGGLVDLNGLVGENLFTDELVSKLAVGLYGAVEGVSISDGTNLAQLLAMTDIDFTSDNVAKLLVDEDYGRTYPAAASVISAAGSWSNVTADSLKWGVTDRDSFFHALAAVLRPVYGVLDVLLNDASLGLFNIVRIPGSNGYTSSIVPLLEAFSCYNIKTQYQYREDINKEYDYILLDIINPLWDKVEDLLNAPLQTLASMIPNLALFIGNDGLCQIIDNLLTPVSALVDAIKPVVNLNDLLNAVFDALNVDLGSLLGKIGVTNFSLDIYDLNATLKPLLGGDAIIPLVNNILGLIKISGQPLAIKLNDVDWLQLASHGETIVSASQAATYGSRIFVEGDSSETLIAVLRYLINTVNTGDNFDTISSLIAGLLGDSVDDSISDVIDTVLKTLQGDTDEVIASLVDLLETLS